MREALAGASFETAVDVAVCDGELLVGLASIEQVLAADPGTPLGELLDETTVVAADMDREQVASQVTKRIRPQRGRRRRPRPFPGSRSP